MTQKPSPALAPAGTHTHTQNNKRQQVSGAQAAAATAGPPSNPCYTMFSWLLCSCSLFQRHNSSERDGCLGHRLFIWEAIGRCKTRRLPQEEVGGFGWKKRETEGGRLSARLHSNTNSNKELVLAWQLAGWLTRCRFSSSSQQLNNPCRPLLTQKPGPAYRYTQNKHGLSLMFAWFSFIWPLKATFSCFDRARKRGWDNKARQRLQAGKVFSVSVEHSDSVSEEHRDAVFSHSSATRTICLFGSQSKCRAKYWGTN